MGQNKFHISALAYLLLLSDIVSISASWILSYFIRFKAPGALFLPAPQSGLDWQYAALLGLIVPIHLYYFFKKGLYAENIGRVRLKEISIILSAKAKSFFTFIFFLYFCYPQRISRLQLWLDLGLGTFCILFGRLLFWKIWKRFVKNPVMKEKMLILGEGSSINSLREKLKQDPKYEILDLWPGNFTGMDGIIMSISVFKNWNPADWVGNNGKTYMVDELPVIIVPEIDQSTVGSFYTDYCGIPLWIPNRAPLGRVDHLVKRVFDFTLSFLGLVVLAPVFVLLSILVRCSGAGPIFYGQLRIGLDGHEFKMWKFRSMKVDAESSTGAVWAIKDDPRKTKIGNFLRKTSLDELPQLYNVLIGDMSLVGPRPERSVFVEKFKREIPRYALRHKMKAGITGWAQVNGWRGNTDLGQRIACDLFYISHWSVWLDVKILLMTLWKGMINKNAY